MAAISGANPIVTSNINNFLKLNVRKKRLKRTNYF